MRIRELVFKKILTMEMAIFLTLFFFAFFLPVFGSQPVTGPLINAALFLAVIFLGVRDAVWIGVFPSIIALFVGFLPMIMAPFIPFIITGNIVLVLSFNYFNDNFWKGVIISSFLKFLVIAISSFIFINYVAGGGVPSQVAVMMSWPQFLTALLGGGIAYLILILLKKSDANAGF